MKFNKCILYFNLIGPIGPIDLYFLKSDRTDENPSRTGPDRDLKSFKSDRTAKLKMFKSDRTDPIGPVRSGPV